MKTSSEETFLFNKFPLVFASSVFIRKITLIHLEKIEFFLEKQLKSKSYEKKKDKGKQSMFSFLSLKTTLIQ